MIRRGGARSGMPRLRRLFRTTAAVAAVVTLTAGCGLLGGSASSEPSADGKVEKARVKIAIIPSTDVAPLWVAQSEGYFAAEGLEVEFVTKGGGGDVITSLLGGDVDFAFASYPLLVQAQQKGRGQVNLKIVADASAARPDATAVVVAKNSPLRSPGDLQGKKIAVTSTGSMADLAVLAGMKAAKADTSAIKFQQMKFPDMLPKLGSGEIDAAFLVEPFVSIAQAQLGVWTVFQPMVGRLDGIALTGYAALEKTTQESPKTVAAFKRAIERAHREASTRKGDDAIRQALVRNANVKPEIGPVLHLPSYPITTDPTRLQRVPDLLHEFGLIAEPFDIKPMIIG
ncbi:ABC transporter substrate-binding protein [Actinokineospora sp.]|uniref:ABC transporter substrate-binding protein n=1 Tax=Actinokineospora sp. TaxID=1872133 RepID=UPI004038292D